MIYHILGKDLRGLLQYGDIGKVALLGNNSANVITTKAITPR